MSGNECCATTVPYASCPGVGCDSDGVIELSVSTAAPSEMVSLATGSIIIVAKGHDLQGSGKFVT